MRADALAALDEARRLRDESRRVIAELQASYAEQAGVRQLKIKHNNFLGFYIETPQAEGETLAESPAQRDLHPSPDDGRRDALHHQRARRPRGAHRLRRRPGAGARARRLRTPAPGLPRRGRTPCAASARRWPRSTSPPRSPNSRSSATGPARVVDASLSFRIESGRHPVVEAALKAAGEPFVANDCDLSGETRRGRAHRDRHRPQHGGQIDLSAPERADRAHRANGRLCSGGSRPHRHRRPPVLARRRGRRSRARPLDLHGRDGRDRGHPQSGEPALARDPR